MLELVETQRYAVLSQRATRQRWFGRSVAAYTDYAPRVDYGDEALRALMEPHLRKMRAARPTTDSSMTARILRYDADRYKLAESLRNALGLATSRPAPAPTLMQNGHCWRRSSMSLRAGRFSGPTTPGSAASCCLKLRRTRLASATSNFPACALNVPAT